MSAPYQEKTLLPGEFIEGEMWGDIPGKEGQYQVSDLGRVRSLPRTVLQSNGKRLRLSGQLLAPKTRPSGHLEVWLAGDSATVHQLVLRTFVGPQPHGFVTRHLNGNPRDNRLGNLTYGTHSENAFDAVSHGAHANTAKRQCIRQHPLSGSNLYVTPEGRRQCRICRAERQRKFMRSKRGQ